MDYLLIERVHSPPKMNWTELAYGQAAQFTPLTVIKDIYSNELNIYFELIWIWMKLV